MQDLPALCGAFQQFGDQRDCSERATYILQNLLPGFSPGFSLIQALAINDKGLIIGVGNPSGPKGVPEREAVRPRLEFGEEQANPHSWEARAAANAPLDSNCGSYCNQGFILTPH
jgi:hypothetical protein